LKQDNNDKYIPYTKNDFREIWVNYDTDAIETFKIIRATTANEKCGFEKGFDYDEEMYIIENSTGEQSMVFDNEILKDCKISNNQWHKGLIALINKMEYNEELMSKFLQECKIEKFIKKYL
jgi:hypothetical protein